MKLHPGLVWRIFHILISDITQAQFFKPFNRDAAPLNCTKICWSVIETFSGLPRKSSEIFRNFRKMFGNVGLAFGTILETLR